MQGQQATKGQAAKGQAAQGQAAKGQAAQGQVAKGPSTPRDDSTLMNVDMKLSAMEEASRASASNLTAEVLALKKLVEKGLLPPSTPVSPSAQINMVDFSEMLLKSESKTKSECMSEASTFLKSEILKGKDEEISTLRKKVGDLEMELKMVLAPP